MTANRSRLLPALVLLAGGLFLTACGGDGSNAPEPTAPAARAKSGGGAAATETGTLAYLAPGKLRVGERAFLVAEDTKVWGSGGICGDGGGQSAVECTVEELEEAAKAGGVKAEVVIGKDGVASEVRDQTPAGSGGSDGSGGSGDGAQAGTVTGVLAHLAPGKLTVGERAFFVAEDTKVWGSGGICGDGSGQSAVECTVEELEEAAKAGGVKAEVVIGKDGVASEVRDQTPAGSGGSDGSGGAAGDDRADGTVTGVLTYLAPGKLEVGGRPFWVAEDTRIWGAGGICGDGSGQSAAECTVEQLEEAARTGGVEAEVVIEQGIATEVREQ